MEKLLEKKTAIITGAANGVGQIISQKFSEEGANLILADMDESNLKKEADLIRKGGSHVEIFCGDLRQNLTIKNLLAKKGEKNQITVKKENLIYEVKKYI